MPAVQARPHKAKVRSKAAARTPTVSGKSKKGNSESQPGTGPALNAQERQKLIAQAAYFRAEKRGFAAGCELKDWIEAEAEVQQLIGGA